VDVRWCL